MWTTTALAALRGGDQLPCNFIASERRHDVGAVDVRTALFEQLDGVRKTFGDAVLARTAHAFAHIFRNEDACQFIVDELCVPIALERHDADEDGNIDRAEALEEA